jgi:hypothetical protein
VPQRRGGPGLGLETVAQVLHRRELRAQHLDRDRFLKAEVVALVHQPHGPPTEGLRDAVFPFEHLARHERRRPRGLPPWLLHLRLCSSSARRGG